MMNFLRIQNNNSLGKKGLFSFIVLTLLLSTFGVFQTARATTVSTCFNPDTLGNSSNLTIGQSWDDGDIVNLQDILNSLGFSIDTVNNQTHYQTWIPTTNSTTIKVKALSHNSDWKEVFGYFQNGTFHPIYKTTDGTIGFESTPLLSSGGQIDVTISGTDIVTFAMYVSDIDTFRYTQNSLNNPNSEYFSVVYNANNSNESYVIAFEDQSLIVQGRSDFDYNDTIVQISCNQPVPPPPVNHAPVITLLGNNPATTTVGSIYNDAGATAQDQEDGDITSHIVVSGTVATSTIGSYTLTYNVSDSQGLPATPVTRLVNVVSAPVIPSVTPPITPAGCFAPDTLGDTTNIAIGGTWDSSSSALQAVLDNLGYSINTSNDQTHYQVWIPTEATTTIIVKSVFGDTAYSEVFGYFRNDGIFHPIFKNTPVSGYESTPNWIHGQEGQITFSGKDHVIFAMYVSNVNQFRYSKNSLNNLSEKFVVVYNASTTKQSFILGFEDMSTTSPNSSDEDFNDTIVQVTCSNAVVTPLPPSANISVNKISDKSTANVLDTVTYTITATNHGPDLATAVTVTDILPSTLNFLSASSSAGNYATTTGIWTIGNLSNGSTTALTILATIKAGNEGVKITNTALASSTTSDTTPGDNTSTVDVTVNTPTCTSNCGGGGGNSPNANISISKLLDKSTANVLDTVTYTITATNHGPDQATGVSIKDILPNTLDFVSATSSLGSYATTTGIWAIGNLANGSSTALTLVATIKAGNEGAKITNTALASTTTNDPTSSDDTSSVDLNVNTPPATGCTSNCGGGGGGGGGGGSNGPIVGSFGGNSPIVYAPQVAGASASCYYLRDYLRKDFNNDPNEVKKLQLFLKDLEGFSDLNVTGVYDDATIVATDAFQIRYKDDVLLPWGYEGNTGTDYVYILTKKKVNEIYCKTAFPVNAQQQAEIDAHKKLWDDLRAAGITIPTGSEVQPAGSLPTPGVSTTTLPVTEIGQIENSSSSNLGTLAGLSSSTRKIVEDMTANVISAGRKLAGAVLSFITWPFYAFDNLFNKATQCVTSSGSFGWLNIILIIVIIIISYLWYREYKNNKKIENINKEIDLR